MSINYCKHTCPAVDSEIESMVSDVINSLSDVEVDKNTLELIESTMKNHCERMKEVGTYKLREGLDECYSDLEYYKRESKELDEQVSDLKGDINGHLFTISSMQNKIDELEYRLDSLEH